MPILANAKKALRVSHKRAEVNGRVRSRAKTGVAKMRQQPTPAHLQMAFSAIDRAVKGRLFHRHKAARIKSQLSKLTLVDNHQPVIKRQVTKKPVKSAQTASPKTKTVVKKARVKPSTKPKSPTTAKK